MFQSKTFYYKYVCPKILVIQLNQVFYVPLYPVLLLYLVKFSLLRKLKFRFSLIFSVLYRFCVYNSRIYTLIIYRERILSRKLKLEAKETIQSSRPKYKIIFIVCFLTLKCISFVESLRILFCTFLKLYYPLLRLWKIA